LVQNVVVARAVAPREFGLYAMALAVVTLLSRSKQVGSAEKLIRDADSDLPASFGAALVVELVSGLVALALLVAGVSLLPWSGNEPRARMVIALLGVLMLQAVADLPAALFHRRLEYRRLATRHVCAALAGVSTTIAAALAGLQVWSLVLGQIAGVAVGAGAFWRGVEPLPRLDIGRLQIREYLAFGLPLWGGGLFFALAERGSVLAVSAVLGLTTLGYVHIAQALTVRLSQANDAANAAMYPALRLLSADASAMGAILSRACRVFALGGIPIGVALALFAGSWIPLVFGARWVQATPFVSVYCLVWGFSTIGYPCHLAFQVRGDTRSMFVFGSFASAARFLTVIVGVVAFGEPGLLVAIACGAGISIAARMAMIRRLLPEFSLLTVCAKPVLTAAAALAATRLVDLSATAHDALVWRGAAFAITVIVGTILFDRATLSDAAAQARGALDSAPFGRRAS